ncbi:MAG: chlorohydrolase [Euryarchaeota archaeon]|nr:chlorohydrolase [Euryarchaeota archaeon]
MTEVPVRYRDSRLIDESGKLYQGDFLLHKDGSWSKSKGDEDVKFNLNGSDRLITRSLQNWHTHLSMILNRGMGEDLPLQRWLDEMIFPTEKKLTKELVELGTKAACAELIATGTTFACDMYYFPKEMANGMIDSGIRGIAGGTITDFPTTSYPNGPEQAINDLDKLLKEGTGNSRVEYAVAPHAIYTCGKETLIKSSELARKHQSFLITHASETRNEVATCHKENNCYPIEYLDSIDFFSKNKTALAHCGWLKKNEMRLMAKYDSKAIHCPTSNMKLGIGGTMSYPAMKEAGVDIRLGTDGAASNNSLDLRQEAKMASMIQRHDHWDASILNPQELWKLATKGSKDWVAWNIDDIRMQPHGIDERRLLANIVYSNADCLDVWVDGIELRHGGITMSLNMDEISEKMKHSVKDYYDGI